MARRREIGRRAARRIAASSRFTVYSSGMGGARPGPGFDPGEGRPAKGPGPVIEGEAEELGENGNETRENGPGPASPWKQ